MIYKISKEEFLQTDWLPYDRLVGECHVDNYGCVYLDKYGTPIDDEYLLENIEKGLEYIKED